LQLAPAAAIVALVLAGIGLRREGGTNFVIGGSFTKWMLWAAIFATLSPLLAGLHRSAWQLLYQVEESAHLG